MHTLSCCLKSSQASSWSRLLNFELLPDQNYLILCFDMSKYMSREAPKLQASDCNIKLLTHQLMFLLLNILSSIIINKNCNIRDLNFVLCSSVFFFAFQSIISYKIKHCLLGWVQKDVPNLKEVSQVLSTIWPFINSDKIKDYLTFCSSQILQTSKCLVWLHSNQSP